MGGKGTGGYTPQLIDMYAPDFCIRFRTGVGSSGGSKTIRRCKNISGSSELHDCTGTAHGAGTARDHTVSNVHAPAVGF